MTAPTDAETRQAHRKLIDITLDGEPVTVDGHDQTPNTVLRAAGIDPATHYLVKIEGRHQTSYKDQGDVEIKVHEGEKFVSVFSGPTPVS